MRSIRTALCGVAMLLAERSLRWRRLNKRRSPRPPKRRRRSSTTLNRNCSLSDRRAGRADWIKSTYITDDTEVLAAKLNEKAIAATVDYAKQATRFDGLELDPVTARKLKLLKLSLTLATPFDPTEAEELTRLVAGMEGTYGKGKYCPGGPETLQGHRRPRQDHRR